MKLGNKGFAISSVLYMALVVFLILITSLLAMMGGRKNILDKLRNDAFANVNGIPEKGTNTNVELDIAFPTMTDNMIPIVYTPTGLVVKADTEGNKNRNWYNYNQRKWANAILVTQASRAYYQSADPGTTINTDDILAYFVWIPRYKYVVNTTTKAIAIVFENKTVGKSSGTGTDTSYYTHPAFTWDGTELNGIWVGKFETSGSMANSYSSGLTGLRILPGKEPISNESVKKMFLNSRKMEVKGNIYGFSQTGTNNVSKILSCTTFVTGTSKCDDDSCMTYCGTIENDSNKLDTHVLKNTEWGAVALLSQSQYGINATLTPNTTDCTGGDCEKLSYLVSSDQSTTGNMYGIYDMSGGLWEITMGYYGTIVFREEALVNYEINTKYYDKYIGGGAAINGDANNLENSLSVLAEYHFSTRGGAGSNPNYVGIYKRSSLKYNENTFLGASDVDSTPSETTGFRISLVIWE